MSRRLLLLLVLAALWFGVLAVRLGDLQIRRHEHYRQRAEKQQNRVVVLTPPRGTIYDRRGHELAVSVEVQSVAADPSQVARAAAAAADLAEVLKVDAGKLRKDLESDRLFTWVKRKVDPAEAARVRELDLPGIFLVPENKRYYPLGTLAAPVLGYVGLDNKGLAGLEYLYEQVVASEPGKRTVVRDAHHGTVLYPNHETSEARPGQDLYLTLDATIQHLVERELAAAVQRTGAQRGMVVMIDPQSGAILAMASYPTFDPNHFDEYPESHWRNQAVMDAFEPGSTFKVVTLAAALEAGAIDPSHVVDCEMGGITRDGVRINDHRPFGRLTVGQVISQSSNVGAIKLGDAAGRRRFFDTITAFGFGRPTGIELPSESSGILRPFEDWTKLSPAYISFGQGISVTALQLANAFAAIANGGRLLKPYVVESISRDGSRRTVDRNKVAGLPISPSSVRRIREMLEGVVLRGTGNSAAVPGYRVAGKTGTAEKAVAGSRGYVPNKHVAGFVGFAPFDRPALVCAVILDEPWPLYHGGEVAAPVFAAIVSRTLLYLGVRPERVQPDLWPGQRSARLAQEAAPSAGSRPAVAPPGTVPDFAGLSARQAVSRSSALGLRPALNGHGAVERQQPPPGTPLELAGQAVELWLSTETM
ncbi:MAG: transpeptidase family protein [bacterium]|nr:transpeptidase family protein [bacterium]